jgi:hypothetical protein
MTPAAATARRASSEAGTGSAPTADLNTRIHHGDHKDHGEMQGQGPRARGQGGSPVAGSFLPRRCWVHPASRRLDVLAAHGGEATFAYAAISYAYTAVSLNKPNIGRVSTLIENNATTLCVR